jgi:bacterioferritin-associated ferredoxin
VVQDARQLVLPLLAVAYPEDPWSSAGLRSLIDRRADLDPVLGEAVRMLEDFELPFLEEEARLAAAGVTLADDLLGFEEAMLEFERAFWWRTYEVYRADPDRWDLPEPKVRDVCERHAVSSSAVRAAMKDQDFSDFGEIAPYVGANLECAECRVGITRLLIAEVRRRKDLPAA